MARRKIVVAMMMHETNTFSPVPTPLASFRPLAGAAAIEEFRDTNTQLGGFLGVAQKAGAEIVMPVAGGAHPSGYVEKSAYEDMAEAIVGAVRGGCDAAFLALHGAVAPVIAWASRPMMTSTLEHTPSRQPMKDIMDMADAAEADGSVLNASVFGGFPHADIPHISCSAVVVCDRRADQGQALCDRLMELAWSRREAFLYKGAPLASQIAHARALGEGPVVLVDHGDNTASGGTQDVMSVI